MTCWCVVDVIYFYYIHTTRKLNQGSPAFNKMCLSLRRPLHFLKTGLLKAGFLMQEQPYWSLFQFQKDFTVKGYKNQV